MADRNKIVINTGKSIETTKDRLPQEKKEREALKKSKGDSLENEKDPEIREEIYIWGNESQFDKKLDPQYLAEKRHYMRVRYVQYIECKMASSNADAELSVLENSIVLTTCDISMGGIGAVCDNKVSIGTILSFTITLDEFTYDITCEVVYCIQNDDKYRIGLKLARKDKDFVKHLKIYVARVSLQSKYGWQNNQSI